MKTHDEQSKNGARGLDNFDKESVISSSTSDNGISRCHICKEPERVIVKPLIPCTHCKARFHPGCHHPTIPTNPSPQQWSCSRCMKHRRISSPLSGVGVDATTPPTVDSVVRGPSASNKIRCTFPGCQKPLLSGSLGLSLCLLHRTPPSRFGAGKAKKKPSKSLFGCLKHGPVRREPKSLPDMKRTTTQTPSYVSKEKDRSPQKSSPESRNYKRNSQDAQTTPIVGRNDPKNPNRKRKRSPSIGGASPVSLGDETMSLMLDSFEIANIMPAVDQTSIDDRNSDFVANRSHTTLEPFGITEKNAQVILENSTSASDLVEDLIETDAGEGGPTAISEDVSRLINPGTHWLQRSENHDVTSEDVTTFGANTTEGTSAHVRATAEPPSAVSKFTPKSPPPRAADYEIGVLDVISAAATPALPPAQDVVSFADAEKIAWGNIDPRTAWPQEREPWWIEEKKRKIAARGGRKAQFGINLSAEMVKERLKKGWHPNQNREALADAMVDVSVRRLFGVPEATIPKVLKNDSIMIDAPIDSRGARKGAVRKTWKPNG